MGAVVGGVTGPIAEGASKVTKTGTEAVGLTDKGEEAEKKEEAAKKIGGKEQTGQNPLGL